jgi:hypothetical protein
MIETVSKVMLVALTICAVGLSLLMPMLVYAAYKDLIRRGSK